ncbi:hypothetical protein FG386_001148 [Cryptosporidium ryanae]|uniref:uncharacterized protein n=1 Tax=Cryptosporidium ryanae TaxID=515981 RepID=UPI00351A740C|nr:hypothetical protein FG386_001148 [Cryptosporidium ryanae]
MSENLRGNVIRSSKISDLTSKIKEAENDLFFSKGIMKKENELGNYVSHLSRQSTKKITETDEISELQLLRIKQIETAQRLKETLRRNVDLMTELQKARVIVRSLEKKINSLESSIESKEISQFMCPKCLKQEEEINKLKLHILELNDSFQKRWDDTQKELFEAKQSLVNVSNKLFESINSDTYQVDSNPVIVGTENRQHDNKFQNREISIATSNNYNPSVNQSPLTVRFSRSTSRNDTETNFHNYNVTNNLKIPSIYDSSSFISRNLPKKNNEVFQVESSRFVRPQSENSFKYSTTNIKPLLSKEFNSNPSYNFQRLYGNGTFHEQMPSIKNIDPISIVSDRSDANPLRSKFQSDNVANTNNQVYDVSPNLLNIYPNNYSTSVLHGYNKNNIQTIQYPTNCGINSYINPNNNQLFKDNNTHLNNKLVNDLPNQNSDSFDFRNKSSFCLSVDNNINTFFDNSSPKLSLIQEETKQPQILQTTFDDTRTEYPSSPNRNETQTDFDIENNTYGNIRRTLEELKKTQDQRVQQLKDDREKLLRAVLNDLQEMKDFQSNVNSSKVEKEPKIRNEQKGYFSLEQK